VVVGAHGHGQLMIAVHFGPVCQNQAA
jgi:hypothetical protein